MPTTEVILTENIRGLGAEADLIKVKRGYARNFLLPKGLAFEVTPASLRRINQLKTKRAEREAREHNEAEDLARKINKLRLTMTLETGAQGKAFGSVTARDLEEAIKKELPNITLERHAIELERPIKDTGEHEVPVKVHANVTATLKVNIKPAVDPAAAAAEGENAGGASTEGKKSAKGASASASKKKPTS